MMSSMRLRNSGRKCCLSSSCDLLLHPLVVAGVVGRRGEAELRDRLRDVARAEVGGQDQHGVLEVHDAALAVGEPAVLQHLQQRVEHVRVGLLDLVEEHDENGLRRTFSVSWPPSS